MKQKEEQKEEQEEPKRLLVLLRTMVNGYMLEVNNEGYMYFDAQSLLEGFCVHVGMKRLGSMTKEEIKDMLEALKDGGVVKKLQDEITALKNQLREQRKQLKKQETVIKNLKEQLG